MSLFRVISSPPRPARSAIPTLILAAVLLAAGHPGAGRAEDLPHARLSIGIGQFPSNFNPLIDSMAAKSYILSAALRPITVYDRDWRLVCLMCESLPTIENGMASPETLADGRKGIRVTYSLKDGLFWGDGVPVGTEDVLFTWKVGRDPQSGVADGDFFRSIVAIDVRDARTFTLHFDRLSFDYNAINDFVLLPAHLEAKAFASPADYHVRSLYETDPGNPGLYDGPYRIARVMRGQYVLLEPNPAWRGRKPYFRQIVVKAIENSQALSENLLSGDIDMVAGEVGMTVDEGMAFARQKRPQWRVIYKPGLAYEHFSVNMDNPVLADRRVRQALLFGLDRAKLVNSLFGGHQIVADGEVNPLDWCYDADVPIYPFDPARAAALLDEAGWKLGKDGLRRNDKGERLGVEIMTTSGNRTREIIELAAQQDWKRLGITVALRNQPPRTFFGDTVLRHAFSSLALFAWISSPENVPRKLLFSDQVPGPANHYAGENVGGYRNKEMDRLIEATERELDMKARRALWNRLQTLYAEDLPDLPLTFRSDPFILPVWLEGVEPTGHQYPTTLWVENWTVAP